MVNNINAQEWLDKEYPLEKRTEITEINSKYLTGSLLIKDWPKLEKIDFDYSKLTELTIVNCPEIKYLDVFSNQLTDLSFLNNLNSESLTHLSIADNKFFAQDLTIFSKFVNLELLWISNNLFTGSLTPLTNLQKLKTLSVAYTKLDSGLECLPENLELICCNGQFAEQLEGYEKEGITGIAGRYDYQTWRKDWEELTSSEAQIEISQILKKY